MSVKERWRNTKEIKLDPAETIEIVLSQIKDEPHIQALYIFGSRTGENHKPYSDLDLAIYTSLEYSWENYYSLYGQITKNIHSDRLDLIWINKADAILNFEIIKTGKLLFYKNADTLNDMELKVKKIYYDYVLYLNKHRRDRNISL